MNKNKERRTKKELPREAHEQNLWQILSLIEGKKADLDISLDTLNGKLEAQRLLQEFIEKLNNAIDLLRTIPHFIFERAGKDKRKIREDLVASRSQLKARKALITEKIKVEKQKQPTLQLVTKNEPKNTDSDTKKETDTSIPLRHRRGYKIARLAATVGFVFAAVLPFADALASAQGSEEEKNNQSTADFLLDLLNIDAESLIANFDRALEELRNLENENPTQNRMEEHEPGWGEGETQTLDSILSVDDEFSASNNRLEPWQTGQEQDSTHEQERRILGTFTITYNQLNIRGDAGTNYEILGKASRGETYNVVATNDEGQSINGNSTWYEIILSDGESTGWVTADAGNFVENNDESTTSPESVATEEAAVNEEAEPEAEPKPEPPEASADGTEEPPEELNSTETTNYEDSRVVDHINSHNSYIEAANGTLDGIWERVMREADGFSFDYGMFFRNGNTGEREYFFFGCGQVPTVESDFAAGWAILESSIGNEESRISLFNGTNNSNHIDWEATVLNNPEVVKIILEEILDFIPILQGKHILINNTGGNMFVSGFSRHDTGGPDVFLSDVNATSQHQDRNRNYFLTISINPEWLSADRSIGITSLLLAIIEIQFPETMSSQNLDLTQELLNNISQRITNEIGDRPAYGYLITPTATP